MYGGDGAFRLSARSPGEGKRMLFVNQLDGVPQRLIGLYTASILLALPALVLVVEHGGSAPYHLTALVAVAAMLWRRPAMPRPLASEERLACLGFGAFAATILIALAASGFTRDAVSDLDVLLRPFWAIPIIILFVRTGPSEGLLWIGLSVGAILAGMHAIFEIAAGLQRARGATSAITFGNTALVMGVTATLGMAYFRQHLRWYPLLGGAALGFGALASLLSGSRGGWVAIPALALILLWYYWTPRYRLIAVGAAATLVLAFLLSVFVPATGVEGRIERAVSEVSAYLEDPVAGGGTSIGQRFELWRAAWDAFLQEPLFGVGIGHSFRVFLRDGVAAGAYHPGLWEQTMPHNVLLDIAALRGLVGLAGLVALWLPLIVIFVGAARESDTRLRALGTAGLTLLVAYALFGLTDSVMQYGPPLAFFSFYSALIVHLIARRRVGAAEGQAVR